MSLEFPDIAPQRVRRFTSAEYFRLVDVDILAPDDPVELLYGLIVEKERKVPPHAFATQVLGERLTLGLLDRACVRSGSSPFAASDDSVPEPDVAVVPEADYRAAHPNKAHLLVEVAFTSQRKDRLKARLYAECNVPEYWLVDVKARTVDVHSDPRDGVYASVTTLRAGDTLTVAAFPDVTIDVASLF